MKLWITETEKVKRQAGEDAVVILRHWKQKVRRLRIYRACLCVMLLLAGAGLMGYGYYLVDNNSMNHTWLNGQQLVSNQPYAVKAGDVIRMADEEFELLPG